MDLLRSIYRNIYLSIYKLKGQKKREETEKKMEVKLKMLRYTNKDIGVVLDQHEERDFRDRTKSCQVL